MASRIEAGSERKIHQGPGPRGLLLAAAGLIVAVGATAGVLGWRASKESAPAQPEAVTAVAAADLPPVAVFAPEPPVVYIVSTQEEAALHYQAIAEADTVRYTMGAPYQESSIFVAATSEEAESFMRLTESANEVRAAEGLPLYRVVDLRH